MPSPLFDLKAKISIGSKVFYSGALEAKTVGFFDKLVKRGIVGTVTKKIHKEFGPRVWDVSEFLETVSDKDLAKNALVFLNSRMESAYEKKFASGGFGKWQAIAMSTWRKRLSMIKSGISGKEEAPLWFTGSLSSAVEEGFKITDFKFFSKDTVSSKGKDVQIISDVSPLDMKLAWIEPEGAWSKTPSWYREKSTLSSFEDLVNIQTQGSPGKRIPPRQIPLWKIVKEKRRFRMGGNREFLQEVWSPFLKQDFDKVFKETSVKKVPETRKTFKRNMVAITKSLREVWQIPEEEYRKMLGDRPAKVIESALTARRMWKAEKEKGG